MFSRILDVKTDRELGRVKKWFQWEIPMLPTPPPLVFQLLSRWRPKSMYLWAFVKKHYLIRCKLFVCLTPGRFCFSLCHVTDQLQKGLFSFNIRNICKCKNERTYCSKLSWMEFKRLTWKNTRWMLEKQRHCSTRGNAAFGFCTGIFIQYFV